MTNEELVRIFQLAGKTVATAESCTGGMVAKAITDVEGASSVFKYGVVSYSNEAKVKLLGVSEETLKKHTAVSEETAIEMAEGIMELADSYVGIATTGYAEPNGVVFVAVVNKRGYKCVIKTQFIYSHTRSDIREKTTYRALEMALEGLVKEGKQ